MHKKQGVKRMRGGQDGFTLVEMLVAAAVLLIGIVGVAELVPVSVGLNTSNRKDSTSLVIAQRELNYMASQPISTLTFSDPQGVLCPLAATCDLGNPASPNTVVGSSVIMLGARPLINFSQAAVTGYSFQYADPDDPSGVTYDIRWAVITFSTGGSAYGKRLIVGVRGRGGDAPLLPITLDSMVER